MGLAAGTRLGPYVIESAVGAGGMGEVYRAGDTRLGRDVAIKVLPAHLAQDPDALARFQREAQVLASLSHPNIATLHGLEEVDGRRFIVMELVEGQTLADRLLKGPLPVDEALEVCDRIAEGLEAAHERGVVHRDLKPANVMISANGKVKILDFGLARVFHGPSSDADQTYSPTVTAVTQPGVVLGTAAYMSPEQAQGKPVDKRTDIWAFGCVLYECLAGRRAFDGDAITGTLAAILTSEPDWTLLAADTPGAVRSVLRRCLEKDPARRLHDIADARIEMHDEIVPSAATVRAPWRPRPRLVMAACAIALVTGASIGALAMKYFRPAARPVPGGVVRAIVRLEPNHWLDAWRFGEVDQPTRTAMAISADGRFVLYGAIRQNPGPQDKPRLYLRRLDQLDARPIAGTEGGTVPFLSPDDRWVGFWADGKLKKVPVGGGVPTVLCDVPAPFGFSWGDDNRIVFVSGQQTGLSRISADGGKPETLTVPDRSSEETSHRLPHCLPAGRGVLFTIMRHLWEVQPRVAALDTSTGKWRVLLEDAADARYIATGRLAFLRQGTLMVVPFDAQKLATGGQPVPAVDNIMQALNTGLSPSNTGAGQFSISASGSLVLAAGGIVPDRADSLVWVDYKGRPETIAASSAAIVCARLSPDGQRIVYQTLGKETQVWVHDVKRGTTTKLTTEGLVTRAIWTPDNRRVVFGWSMTGPTNLYWQPADGSAPMERLSESPYTQFPGSWSPDGQALALVQPVDTLDILLFRPVDRKVVPFLGSRFNETAPDFSPDGRWISYTSDESGRAEVYVQGFPGPGGRWQISNEGGTQSLWSRDGRQLFYRRLHGVWVVDIQTEPTFSASKPRLVFEQAGYGMAAPVRAWDISPDGRRFLMVKLGERQSQPVTDMILVQNWLEELKQKITR